MHLFTERFVWILSYILQYFNKTALRLQCTIQSAINWTIMKVLNLPLVECLFYVPLK